MKIEFYRHSLSEKDVDNAVDVLHSLILTHGKTVEEFEKRFSEYIQCKYTIAVNSCTGALHMSLLAYDIGEGDEVITTPMTFIATANSIIMAGATPVFVDVEPETGNMDASLIERAITFRTKAIMPVHLYGQMCDMRRIRQIADKYGLIVIEDAAHCVEGIRDGVRPSMMGDTACFSYFSTKNLTSGEGGAICVNDDQIAETLKKLRLHGMSKGSSERYTSARYQHWDMEILGWKYNMDNIHAALLIDQIYDLNNRLKIREIICNRYEKEFDGVKNIRLLKGISGSKSARHLFTILVSPEIRDEFMLKLQERGIGITVNYRAIHLLSYYRNKYGYKRGDFPIAEKIGDSTITLPLYPKLEDREIEYVIKTVLSVAKS